MQNIKLMILLLPLLLVNQNYGTTMYNDLVIDQPNQTIRIDSPCDQLIIKKEAVNCHLTINAHVHDNVFVEADNCTIDCLKHASFGKKSWWYNWLWSWMSGSDNGNRFYIHGNNFKLCSYKKSIDASFTIHGNTANFDTSLSGSATIIGNDCTINGSVNGSARIEGNNSKIHDSVNGSATILGNNCIIQDSINGSATISGDDCHIYGSVNGSLRVSGNHCKINGSVNGAATVKGDTIISGGICGSLNRTR